jgi:hypothetical protein
MDPSPLPEPRVAEIIARVAEYMRKEHALYRPASDPLSAEWKNVLRSYFPKSLLDTVRAVTLEGARIPPPPFYAEALAMSSGNFPDFVHLASVTYIDVIVFNEKIAGRTLFHGLVHAQQMNFLGLDAYVALYVRGFLKSRSWLHIPLETQAFKLEERFLMSPPDNFSVQEEVNLWLRENRYV